MRSSRPAPAHIGTGAPPPIAPPARVSTSWRPVCQITATPTSAVSAKIVRQLARSISTAPRVGASIGATTIAVVR